mmetsp:Transcript_9638/g.15251  ORF Transcript_9638/g.15251 Transcript_9638/m.15251 type:complete len:92 (+) Transcript_9638:1653-1928(+)
MDLNGLFFRVSSEAGTPSGDWQPGMVAVVVLGGMGAGLGCEAVHEEMPLLVQEDGPAKAQVGALSSLKLALLLVAVRAAGCAPLQEHQNPS